MASAVLELEINLINPSMVVAVVAATLEEQAVQNLAAVLEVVVVVPTIPELIRATRLVQMKGMDL